MNDGGAYVGIIVGSVLALLIVICISIVVGVTQLRKERSWLLAILLFFLCGGVPALVYVLVTVDSPGPVYLIEK